MPSLKLSELTLRDLPTIAAKEGLEERPLYFWDTKTTGLAVRLNVSGSVAWVMKVRVGKKDHWKSFGRWPAMPLKEARSALEKMRVRINSGKSPDEDSLIPCLWGDLVDRYMKEHFPDLKPKTQASYKSALLLHVRPAFDGKLVHEISDHAVKTFHRKLGATGKTRQANVCFMLIRVLFDRAEAWKHRPLNSNPVDKLTKGGYKQFTETPRDRPLSEDEIVRIGQALNTMEEEGWGQFCDFALVLYFSGARRSEVLGLSWDWIDTDRQRITWPDSKTGEISKPMNDALFEVLAGIPRWEDNPWVFPSPDSESGHLEDIKRPWKKMLKLAGIKDKLTRHDLRHNVGNQAADEGENLQTVAALLSHRNTATTDRYSKTRGLDASMRLGDKMKRQLRGGK